MRDHNWQTEMDQSPRRETTARHILGVSDSDDAETIRRAWRKLSLEHHPDNNGGDLESHRRFILVNCAYRFLTEGNGCEELDVEPPPDDKRTGEKYAMDNSWGYFAWWRENYFGPDTTGD